MTISWSFSDNSFEKLSLYNKMHSYGPQTKHYKGDCTVVFIHTIHELELEFV